MIPMILAWCTISCQRWQMSRQTRKLTHRPCTFRPTCLTRPPTEVSSTSPCLFLLRGPLEQTITTILFIWNVFRLWTCSRLEIWEPFQLATTVSITLPTFIVSTIGTKLGFPTMLTYYNFTIPKLSTTYEFVTSIIPTQLFPFTDREVRMKIPDPSNSRGRTSIADGPILGKWRPSFQLQTFTRDTLCLGILSTPVTLQLLSLRWTLSELTLINVLPEKVMTDQTSLRTRQNARKIRRNANLWTDMVSDEVTAILILSPNILDW